MNFVKKLKFRLMRRDLESIRKVPKRILPELILCQNKTMIVLKVLMEPDRKTIWFYHHCKANFCPNFINMSPLSFEPFCPGRRRILLEIRWPNLGRPSLQAMWYYNVHVRFDFFVFPCFLFVS